MSIKISGSLDGLRKVPTTRRVPREVSFWSPGFKPSWSASRESRRIDFSSSRKERDRRIRRADILRAAERVFAAKGYYDATIQDIAKESEYAAGTIYLYFKDKEALYLFLFEEKIGDLVSLVREKVDGSPRIEDKINNLVRVQLSFFEENQDFFRIFVSEKGEFEVFTNCKITKAVSGKFTQYLEYITGLIKRAQAEGMIRGDFESRQLAHMLVWMLSAAIIRWLKKMEPERRATLKDASDLIMDVFLNGTKKRK